MILLIRQYLASLKERRELDAILPDLLLQLGFQVYSRPGIGTRQDGVDVAAVGIGDDKRKKVFLFSIKSGDLNRAAWDGTTQGLRPSLNEILDAYIPTRIPSEFRDLPIVICPCWGGKVDETVQVQLNGFVTAAIKRFEHLSLSFENWDGDKLTTLIAKGFMREELMPAPLASHLRKAIALVEEPDNAVQHFSRLVAGLFEKAKSEPRQTETTIRQMTLCLWILYGWATEADNIDAPQRCSEQVLLRVWELTKAHMAGKSKRDQSLAMLLNGALEAYLAITDTYLLKICRGATVYHGLGSSVHTSTSIDVNLKLFDFIGRLGCFGLWQHTLLQKEPDKGSDIAKARIEGLLTYRDRLIAVIENNPVLRTPLTDDQAIDINVACLFLSSVGASKYIASWIGQMTVGCIYSFLHHDHYPSRVMDYRELLAHPKAQTDDYRKKVTPASILYPVLAVWARLVGNTFTLEQLADFVAHRLQHCNFQVLMPDLDTESRLYLPASHDHGAVLDELKITADGSEPLGQIRKEIEAHNGLQDLSPTKFGLHALIILACRNQRIPVPPQYWPDIPEAKAAPACLA